MKGIWFTVCFTLSAMEASAVKNFTGHVLLGAFPSNKRELEFLRNLQDNLELDFWNDPLEEYSKVSIVVAPEGKQNLENLLRSKGVDYYIATDNLQKWIDKEKEENGPSDLLSGRVTQSFALDTYHSSDEILEYISEFARQNSNISVSFDMGTTHQGQAIRGIKIGTGIRQKPAVLIDGGIHAREWIAPATCLWMLNNLVNKYQKDSEVTKLLDTFDFYFLPLVNPDGYKYTWTTNRLWRKNRSPSEFYNCFGTDPNRNFEAHFGGAGTSGNPCSDIYHGTRAFSEPESRAVRDAVIRLQGRLKAYFSLHSFSQLWMFPYGYTKTSVSRSHNDLMRVSRSATDAIVKKHGMYYRSGTISETIYPATGSSADWVHDVGGVKYSFVLELRDQGQFGFILPRYQIIPTAEECWEGIKTVVQQVANEI